MLILIESFRLTTATCCCIQVFSQLYIITPIFDITIVSGQFLSIVFALAQCIHLSNVVLHIQRNEEPEREMKYEMKQRRLRYVALGTIIILCLALIVICTLELVWHVEAHNN